MAVEKLWYGEIPVRGRVISPHRKELELIPVWGETRRNVCRVYPARCRTWRVMISSWSTGWRTGMDCVAGEASTEYKEEVLRCWISPGTGRNVSWWTLKVKPCRYAEDVLPELRNACYIVDLWRADRQGWRVAAVKLINEQKVRRALKMLKAWENDDRA